mmetsp:Transcript_42635/g.102816  ORF Transcript_42635/g.102816 Transcript_42635/m.102816 type:complete len:80 (-) Transcript_42635:116-355(-)
MDWAERSGLIRHQNKHNAQCTITDSCVMNGSAEKDGGHQTTTLLIGKMSRPTSFPIPIEASRRVCNSRNNTMDIPYRWE